MSEKTEINHFINSVSTTKLDNINKFASTVEEIKESDSSEGNNDEMEKEINKSIIMSDELSKQFKLMQSMRAIEENELKQREIQLSAKNKIHTIFFDLDETLSYVTPYSITISPKPYYQKISYIDKSSKKEICMLAYKRPYLEFVLKTLADFYELIVFN